MDERTQLAQRLESTHARLEALVQSVGHDVVLCPGWTCKEVLAHLAGWDDVAVDMLRAHARGAKPRTPALTDIDAFNAEWVAARQTHSVEQLRHEWEQLRGQFVAAIREMPEEKLNEPFVYPWGPTGTVAQLVELFAEHDEEHAQEIEKLMNG